MGAVLKSVGYGKGLQTQPRRVLESTGFKQAIRELGLTEALVTEALVVDIKHKPWNRIQELKLGAEILGMVRHEDANELPKTNTIYNFIFSAEAQAEIRQLESKIKARLINAETNKTSLATD